MWRASFEITRRRIAAGLVLALGASVVLAFAVDSWSRVRASSNRDDPRSRERSVPVASVGTDKARNARPLTEVGGSRSRRAPGNPFTGERLYVDRRSNAARQVELWSQTQPAAARALRKIASRPQASWFSGSDMDVRASVDERVSLIAAAGALPVLFAYNIVGRDCSGGYSSGGASSPARYRRWIGSLAAGIGAHKAVVILEPDALADLDCLGAAARRDRLALIRYAIRQLESRRRVSVYVDAGHSRWHSAREMAHRLEMAGAARARGFALNVANFLSTGEQIAYGQAISEFMGTKPFVVDTSRNGRGPHPGMEWCNPPGRGVGRPPTTRAGHPLVDALLWMKPPGESDGACRGAPPAGTWWPEYALELARRAAD